MLADTPLPLAASATELATCASSGCWHHDAAAAQRRIRFDASDGAARTLVIQ